MQGKYNGGTNGFIGFIYIGSVMCDIHRLCPEGHKNSKEQLLLSSSNDTRE